MQGFWPATPTLPAVALGASAKRSFPDFLIGAHAAVTGRLLLTRDPRRVAAYTPRGADHTSRLDLSRRHERPAMAP